MPDLADRDDLARVIAVGCLAIYFKAISPRHLPATIRKKELLQFRIAFLHLMRIFARKYIVYEGDELCRPMSIFRHAVFNFGQAIINYAVQRDSELPGDSRSHQAYAQRSEHHLIPARVHERVTTALLDFWPQGRFQEFDLPDAVRADVPMRIIDLGPYVIRDAGGHGTGDLPIKEFDIQRYIPRDSM